MISSKRLLKGQSIIEFPEDFIVFDIETTGLDPRYDEIIEIGAIKIENNKIVDTFSTLIKPTHEISPFISGLTGITNDMVQNAPGIEDVLPKFMAFIKGFTLMGHNVNFDINFIYDNLVKLGLAPLENSFIDTLRIAKRILSDLEHHRLKDLAQYYKIDDKGSHRALKDVEITLEVYRFMKEEIIQKYGSIEDFQNTIITAMYRVKASNITTSKTTFDEENPFYHKFVAITGVLEKMNRKEVMQYIVDAGGFCEDNVSSKTDYLILGNNDYNPILKGKKSSKQKRAEGLKKAGYDILIISENVFYDMIEETQIKN